MFNIKLKIMYIMQVYDSILFIYLFLLRKTSYISTLVVSL